jgi:hypothetical protein
MSKKLTIKTSGGNEEVPIDSILAISFNKSGGGGTPCLPEIGQGTEIQPDIEYFFSPQGNLAFAINDEGAAYITWGAGSDAGIRIVNNQISKYQNGTWSLFAVPLTAPFLISNFFYAEAPTIPVDSCNPYTP